MASSVFAILTLVILDAAGMAQMRYWYLYFPDTVGLPDQVQNFHPPTVTTKSDEGWLNPRGAPVRAGTVEFNFDFSSHLDRTPGKEGKATSLALDKKWPSFGWNLETPMSWQTFPELTKPLMEEETYEIITPQLQVIGYMYMRGCGNDLITSLTLEQQEAIDDSMWRAVCDMPKSIKDALIEEGEHRSGKAFMVPTEPRWIWYTEVQELYSKKGTTTKITGPAGPKLIRITGDRPSEIYGALDAGGDDIYLNNPQGVFVGPESRIK